MDRKRIFYGVSGEGLGHCSRALAMIENMPDYELHIFTWGDAYKFLNELKYPHLHLIPGLHFGRVNGKIDSLKTAFNFLYFYFFSVGPAIKQVVELAKDLEPSAVITDFEPILARCAKKLRLTLTSVDTQHKFECCDWLGLPWRLKFYSFVAAMFIGFYIPHPNQIIVSTFYYNLTKIIKGHLTNVFFRKEFDSNDVSDNGFALFYYKASIGKELMEILSEVNVPVVVYGVPEDQQIYPQFTYKKVDYTSFVYDLKKCKYVFAGAGNQLLGEAIALGKPVFAVPEPNQDEQSINGWYLEIGGNGVCCYIKDLNKEKVISFIENFQPSRAFVHNGVFDAKVAILRMVPK